MFRQILGSKMVVSRSYLLLVFLVTLYKLGLNEPIEEAIRSAVKEKEEKICIRLKWRITEEDYTERGYTPYICDSIGDRQTLLQ